MTRPTAEQIDFFLHYRIPLSQVFDASGYSRGEYETIMGALEMVVAIGVTPCAKAGHTVRTRAGHCAQCGTHNLAFLRRYDDPGFVYVATSDALRLTKVGTSQNVYARLESLNGYDGYGRTSDWSLKFALHCIQAGRIEFHAQQKLLAHSEWRNYDKQGEVVRGQELFKCSAKVAVAAVKKVLAEFQ